MPEESTITISTPHNGESITMPVDKFDRAVEQLTLSDTLFPPVKPRDVPMVKVAISGTIELTRSEYESYLDGTTLGPGAVVEIRASGYVVMPGAAWVKRTERDELTKEQREWFEREGRVKVKLMALAGLEPTGEEWSE